MTILPLAYLGSVEYFAHMLREECVVDIHEHFIKRSERNRTRILTANGVMELSIQVQNANHPCTPMLDIKIDYSKRWQHQHWISILSAYKSSPYFDHFCEYIKPFYTQQYDNLVDYNLAFTQRILSLMGVSHQIKLSESYIIASDSDRDLRPKDKYGSTFIAEPYYQVFADRMPFEANLSILDLLFAEGRNSVSVLADCQL